MSYLVLARKWRPMTFDDLVGQEHVSRTLSNAIVSGRIAHAFLFTGVRGVGKTTSARILAKSLNCEKGPTPSPCLQCPACKEIAAGNDMDVQEIDGASYNGVDEVRKLQESLPYRPSRDRFKVVIVDEVHMLSQSAWNAFLKTLEEPPPHVKFIFATTEVHKVPVTILSRCQRYDFKLIPAAAIAKRLRFVLDQEHIEADEAALGLMAREAAGSMRDAMSLLDQAIAWGGEKLVGEEIARVLGIAGRSVLLDLCEAMIDGDAPRSLELVSRLADQGFDLVQLAKDTLESLRDLVVVKVCKDPGSLTELTPEEIERVRGIVGKAGIDDLMRLHLGFSRGFDQMVHAPQQRSALEMLLVRLAMRPPLLPIDDLAERIDALDRRLAGRGAAPGRHTAPHALQADRVVASSVGTTMRSVEQPRVAGGGRAAAVGLAPRHDEPVLEEAVQPRQVTTEPVVVPESEPETERLPPPSDEAPTRPLHAVHARTDPAPPPSAAIVEPPSDVRVQRHTEPAPTEQDPDVESQWRIILDLVREKNAALASVLEHAVPLEVSRRALRLAVEEGSFYADRAREEQDLDLLTRVVRDHFRAPTEVSFSLEDAKSTAGRTVYEQDEAARAERERQARERLERHKLVRAAVESLGARIQKIKVNEP